MDGWGARPLRWLSVLVFSTTCVTTQSSLHTESVSWRKVFICWQRASWCMKNQNVSVSKKFALQRIQCVNSPMLWPLLRVKMYWVLSKSLEIEILCCAVVFFLMWKEVHRSWKSNAEAFVKFVLSCEGFGGVLCLLLKILSAKHGVRGIVYR